MVANSFYPFVANLNQ